MLLTVHVIPNASRDEIVGWHEGALKIRVAAPPVEGKANEALIRLLAKKLHLSPFEIAIEKGATDKRKRIKIPLTEEDAKAVLSSIS